MAKQLWVLAGANGSGKSTFYRLNLAPKGMAFVNADRIAIQLDKAHTVDVSYQAATIAEKLRKNLLLSGNSFCFETVFSHPSKIDFVADAKALGYDIILVYIHLIHHELNQARVKQRVSEGGHDVPVDKIISRIPRTMQCVRMALPLVDRTYLLDNSFSDRPFEKVALLTQGKLTLFTSPLPAWAQEMLSGFI